MTSQEKDLMNNGMVTLTATATSAHIRNDCSTGPACPSRGALPAPGLRCLGRPLGLALIAIGQHWRMGSSSVLRIIDLLTISKCITTLCDLRRLPLCCHGKLNPRPPRGEPKMENHRLIKSLRSRFAVAFLVSLPVLDGWAMIATGIPLVFVIGVVGIVATLVLWAMRG